MSEGWPAEVSGTDKEVGEFLMWLTGVNEQPLPDRLIWLATCITVTCKDRGLLLRDLGPALGHNEYYVYQLRKGNGHFDGKMAKRLIEFLGVGPWWLRRVQDTYEERHKYRRS